MDTVYRRPVKSTEEPIRVTRRRLRSWLKLVRTVRHCHFFTFLRGEKDSGNQFRITRIPPQEGNGNNEREAFHSFILLHLVGLQRPRYSETALIALSSIINSQQKRERAREHGAQSNRNMFPWTCTWIQSDALLHCAVCISEFTSQSSLQVGKLHWLPTDPRARHSEGGRAAY